MFTSGVVPDFRARPVRCLRSLGRFSARSNLTSLPSKTKAELLYVSQFPSSRVTNDQPAPDEIESIRKSGGIERFDNFPPSSISAKYSATGVEFPADSSCFVSNNIAELHVDNNDLNTWRPRRIG